MYMLREYLTGEWLRKPCTLRIVGQFPASVIIGSWPDSAGWIRSEPKRFTKPTTSKGFQRASCMVARRNLQRSGSTGSNSYAFLGAIAYQFTVKVKVCEWLTPFDVPVIVKV